MWRVQIHWFIFSKAYSCAAIPVFLGISGFRISSSSKENRSFLLTLAAIWLDFYLQLSGTTCISFPANHTNSTTWRTQAQQLGTCSQVTLHWHWWLGHLNGSCPSTANHPTSTAPNQTKPNHLDRTSLPGERCVFVCLPLKNTTFQLFG